MQHMSAWIKFDEINYYSHAKGDKEMARIHSESSESGFALVVEDELVVRINCKLYDDNS